MFKRGNPIVFKKGNVSALFVSTLMRIKNDIEGETEDYILNVNELEYSAHLANKYKFLVPEIHFDQVYADSYDGPCYRTDIVLN